MEVIEGEKKRRMLQRSISWNFALKDIMELCFEGQKKAEDILKEVKSKGMEDYEISAQAFVEHDEKGRYTSTSREGEFLVR